MTIDERIEKLTANQERMDENQRRFDESQQKTQVLLAQIVENLGRLERIALSHEVRLDDVEATLARLEGRKRNVQ